MEEDQAATWVVIPAYNEKQVVGDVVARVLGRYSHAVVVDDASSDETAVIAAREGAVVLQHPVNLGQGAALQTGITFALTKGAEYIDTFDSDGQHQVDDIDRLISALRKSGADVALGSRFHGQAIGVPWSRRVLLKAATSFTRLTTGLKVSDTHNGFRVLNRRAAATLHIRQNRMAHASEILSQISRNGLRYIEVPVTIKYTEYSLLKGQRMGDAANILADLFMGRFVR
jgi:glycosyltransferase involved in cell wall biosynthesis